MPKREKPLTRIQAQVASVDKKANNPPGCAAAPTSLYGQPRPPINLNPCPGCCDGEGSGKGGPCKKCERCCRGPTGKLEEDISVRKDLSYLEQMFIRSYERRKIHDYYNKVL